MAAVVALAVPALGAADDPAVLVREEARAARARPLRVEVHARRLAVQPDAPVRLVHAEARADDRLLARIVPVLDVRGRHHRAVRQQVDARIAAVVAVHELHAVGALRLLGLDRRVRTHPRHEMPARGRFRRRVAEHDHEPSVRQQHALMSVARKRPRRVLGLRPRLALVAAEHHQAAARVRVLADEAAELAAVRRAEHVRLARILALHRADRPRLTPREAAVLRHALQHAQRRTVDSVRPRVVEPEVRTVLQLQGRAKGQ